LRLQDFENQLLFAHARGVLYAHLFSDGVKVDDALVFEFHQVERDAAWFALLLFPPLLAGVPLMWVVGLLAALLRRL
jgi:hypothetical protein